MYSFVSAFTCVQESVSIFCKIFLKSFSIFLVSSHFMYSRRRYK